MPTLVDITTNVIDVTTDVGIPATGNEVPDTPAPEEEPERERELVFELRDLEVKYSGHTAVREVDLDIAAHEITAFIGPSGCGKSTVLRSLNRMNDLIAGAEVIGQVDYHGQTSTRPKVDPVEVRRRIGMVFQKPNPFPKSIYDNVAFGPASTVEAQGARRHRRAGADPRRALGRGEGQAQEQRRSRSPAASSSACASPARSRSSPT